jgi:hypothetical protein
MQNSLKLTGQTLHTELADAEIERPSSVANEFNVKGLFHLTSSIYTLIKFYEI